MSAAQFERRDWFDISGKVALVTGGRRGLGRAMALGLARAQAKVAIAASHADSNGLEEEAAAAGAELLCVQADLADRAQRAKVIPKVIERFGRLDILVNCAGIQHRERSLDFSIEKWDTILSLMLTGVFELCQEAGRVMVRQGGGKIVNIASLSSFQGGWTIPAYTAAKHGVAGITKALANEWASKNINVNAIAPGYFETDMCEALVRDPVREPKIRDRIPAGRWGRPEDMVGPLLFLVSDAARYVHGHLLVVDGGWMAR
ncbi:MAG: SDR family oxidoreductase [Candidatus Brocadiia bacterium]